MNGGDLIQIPGLGAMISRNYIPFTLKATSDVSIYLYDIAGRKLANILRTGLTAGEHTIKVDRKLLGIPAGNYVYQIEVADGNGTSKQCRIIATD